MSRPSAPATVVIPGYMGTTLQEAANGKAVWNGMKMFWVDYNRMRPDREGAAPNDNPKLVPGHPLWPVYPGLIRRLRREGYNTYSFPFDWRKSLPQIVEEFDSFVSRKIPPGPVNFVTHSMGGHIAAIWLAGKGGAAVERFVSVAMPVRGVEKAITILLEGDKRIARFNVRASAGLLRKLAWEVPSIYEMLPPLPGIFRRDAWPSELGIREDLLAGAERTRNMIDNSLPAVSALGERALLIAGAGDKTDSWIKRKGSPLAASGKQTSSGDGWIRQDSVAIAGVRTLAYFRKWTDLFTLKLHYPSVLAIGSHPVLPMYHGIQKGIIDFLAGRKVTSLSP